MSEVLSRIKEVACSGRHVLDVTWRDGTSDRVDLSGWVATGGDLLEPLRGASLFAAARLGAYGASVEWGEPDGDLAIDADHLHQIAEAQRPFERNEVAVWQARVGLSNQETAAFLSVSLSTWNAYKAGASKVPVRVGMLCRAALRDPILLQAHYRPRRTGRPRKADAA